LTRCGVYLDKNARILVIDDDKVIRYTLTIALEDEGYVVDTAKNGKEAVEKTRVNFYNLAIVDWRLPDIEGTKLLRKLKETTPKMAKIMLTGYPSMNNAINAVNERADAFLTKPIEVEELLAKMKELLKLQEEENHYCQAKVAEFIQTRTEQILKAKTGKKLAI
jgi:DNA-binding response OmpR family regulator